MGRADHHADSVIEIILAIVGGVVWRLKGRFMVREYNGSPANILWMEGGDEGGNVEYEIKKGFLSAQVVLRLCSEPGRYGVYQLRSIQTHYH